MGDLRIGVRAPGQGERARAGAAEEERVLDDDPRLEVGVVRELVRRAHVAGGVDPRVGGPQSVVDGHARARVVGDADDLEAEPLDVGRAARRRPGSRPTARRAAAPPRVTVDHARRRRLARRARSLAPRAQVDAVADSARSTRSAASAVLAAQDLALALEQRHAGAEARERLGQLAADRARADHGEPARQLGQGEHRLVREIAGLGQPGDGRRRRARAGGDHRPLEAERLARDLDGVRPGEARRAEEHVHAEVAEARGRVGPAESPRAAGASAPLPPRSPRAPPAAAPARRTRPPRARRRRRAPRGSGSSTARSRR